MMITNDLNQWIMKKSMLFSFCFLLSTNSFSPVLKEPVQLFLTNYKEVAFTKRLANTNKEIRMNVNKLSMEADSLLNRSINPINSKKTIPPSGDLHDYISMATYWWPDSSKADGLPYIRKDGQRNPEILKIEDNKNLNRMISMVWKLSWAYFFTDDEKYALKTTQILRFWFIDPKTKMNPNLNYAQFIPGRNEGRGSGIIDFHRLPLVIEAIGLVSKSRFLSEDEKKEIKKWFYDYKNWLESSENGRSEAKAPNNHGTYYEAQLSLLLLFLGEESSADKIFHSAIVRISNQINLEGQQPLELVRTQSFMYSVFNLQAWFILCKMAKNRGIDLWHYKTNDGRGIQKAIDYLMPYILHKKEWDHQQIREISSKGLYQLLMDAYKNYSEIKYKEAANTFVKNETSLNKLLYR